MRRAVVLAVIGLLGLTACGDGENDAGPATTSATLTSPSEATTSAAPTTSGPPPTTTTDSQVGAEEAAIAVVSQWLDAIAEGDSETVFEMLGGRSQAAVGSMGGIESLMSGLAEGMAAFGSESTQKSATEIPGQPGAYLVTFSGDVQREGATEFAARSWPVYPSGEADVIEAFSVVAPEIVSPAVGTSDLAADGAVSVYMPAGGTPVALLDGEPLQSASQEPADGDRVLVSVAPPEGGWPQGRHVVSVAVVPNAPGGDAPFSAAGVAITVG